MTTSENEFDVSTGMSAGDYLDNFILWATRLSPDEQEIWNMLCRKRGGNFYEREEKRTQKLIKRLKKDNSMLLREDFNPELLQEDAGPLTEKERQVLKLLMLGYSFNDCANFMCVTHSTLKTHVTNIYQKKHVSNLHQLMVKVYNPQLGKSEEGLNFEKFNKEDVMELQQILGGS